MRIRLSQRRSDIAGPSGNDCRSSLKIPVDRLDLERYKAIIKGLAQFGDPREGTDRNRKAISWIEVQLKKYACANREGIVISPRVSPRILLDSNKVAKCRSSALIVGLEDRIHNDSAFGPPAGSSYLRHRSP